MYQKGAVQLNKYPLLICQYAKRMVGAPLAKAFIAVSLWALHLLFGPSIRPALVGVLVLFFLDLGLGIWIAWLNPTDQVRSESIRLSFVKLLLYLIVIAVGRQMALAAGIAGAMIQGILEALAGGTEALSVLENVDVLGQWLGYEIPWLRRVINAIRGRQEKTLTALEKGESI